MDTFGPGGLICWCHIFLAFYTIHEVLTASILGWFAIPASSGLSFVRTLCYDLSILGGPAWHGFTELCKPLCHDKVVDANSDSLEKSPVLGNIEGRRGCQRIRWLAGMTDAMNMSLGKFREMVRDREARCAAVYGFAKDWTQLGG